LRTLVALACVAAAGCGGGTDVDRPLAGVLITLDTTRSDALGTYGAGDDATPRLDALARESVVFEGARTVAPLTLPSHASMLTGLYPPRHGVRDNGLAALPASASTLAERARAGGFETAAFVAAVVLGSPWGLAQGFETYDEVRRGGGGPATGHMGERSAAAVTAAAVAWLEARDDERPFFLWVHYFDPHEPYAPPPEYLGPGASPDDTRARYAAEVRAMDASIGALVDALDEHWGLDDLLLTVVSDHGEGFGQHGEDTHSVLVYEELIHVPLFVRPPGPRGAPTDPRAGTRDPRVASVVDVHPTYLAALGLGSPGAVDGRALLAPSSDDERGVYFESMAGYLAYGWSPLVGWLDARGKYTHSSAPELYDLEADPGERRNLAEARADELERYRRALAALEARPTLERGAEDAVDESDREGIGALGYADVAGGEVELPRLLAPSAWPHPRERMDELDAFHEAVLGFNAAFRARDEAAAGRAIEAMAGIVDQNPNNVYALNVLASFLYQTGNHADALRCLRRIPPHGVDRLNVQDMLGHCLEALGRPGEALPHFQRADVLKPNDPHQIEDLVRVLRALGRDADAAREAERLHGLPSQG